LESAAADKSNKTQIPYVLFNSSPDGDTIIIHHSSSFFDCHAFAVE